LARAILKNAPIFVLDEPVTGLDSATEAKLNETLDRLMKGRTSFTIAHRLSTIMRADLILMIEEERVVEQGTHEDLLGKSDRYRQLYDLQRLDHQVLHRRIEECGCDTVLRQGSNINAEKILTFVSIAPHPALSPLTRGKG
jgi:ABC-type multidrug transport system ATPase subunit